jgi:crotonobetainyl-CoA:carnitine CoA-transferase CaiB-like acyl-CoA transferase
MTNETAAMLQGIRVLDLSRLVTGPFATSMLAELGADVIKVENPRSGGDETRGFPPFAKGISLYYAQLNHSRRSIAIDLKHPEGVEIVRQLAERSDVVVQNFLPGVADRLGIGYDDLSARNPRIIYLSASGFGGDGPFSGRKAYDSLMQAVAGLTAITGEPDRPPVKAGIPASDVGTAIFGAFGIAAALYRREITGRGQHIEVNMLESLIAMMSVYSVDYINTGRLTGRIGTRHRYRVPSGVFTCRDDTMLHVTMGDPQFPSFARAVGHPEWLDDARFAEAGARVEHRDEVEAIIGEVLLERTAQEWYDVLDAAGVPAGPVNTFKEVFAHPQVLHHGIVRTVENAAAGEDPLHLLRMPVHFDGGSGEVTSTAPALGEHTDEVLSELLGLGPVDLDRLRKGSAIA